MPTGSSRLASSALLLLLVLVSSLGGTVSASLCPALSDAVVSQPDFNSTTLTILWFVNRGLNRGNRYGCAAPSNTTTNIAPYIFASGCGCESWEQCQTHDMDYVGSNNVHYSSPMGECGCCAWWVIFLIVLGSLCVVIAVIATPFIIHRWRQWRKQSKFRTTYGVDLGKSTDGDEMTAIAPKAPAPKRSASGPRVRRRRPAKDVGPAPSTGATARRPSERSGAVVTAVPQGAFAVTIDKSDDGFLAVASTSPLPTNRAVSGTASNLTDATGFPSETSPRHAQQDEVALDDISFDSHAELPDLPSGQRRTPPPM